MKLPEHVDKIRNLIEAAFDKQFARLGIGKAKLLGADKLPPEADGSTDRKSSQQVAGCTPEEKGGYSDRWRQQRSVSCRRDQQAFTTLFYRRIDR